MQPTARGLAETYCSVGANLGLVVGRPLDGNGPVHQEQINVVELQVLERVVQRPLDWTESDGRVCCSRERELTLIGLVEVVPHFCADEEILARNLSGLLLQKVGDGIANLGLVLVEPRAVEVPARLSEGRATCRLRCNIPVSGLEGSLCGSIRLADGALARKGAEADGGDGDAIVEGECASERHDV